MVLVEILNDLNMVSITVRILLSLTIGGVLGLERGRKRHPAGFRTYMLVCLGSAMVMMTNQYIIEIFGGSDPARLGAQVVSGIGFLGAGTIIVTRRNQVKGLTTAAGLWTAACVGLAVGIGFYEGAIIVGVVVLLIMTAFQKFDSWVVGNSKYMHIYVSFETIQNFDEFMDYCQSMDIQVRDIELTKSKVPKEAGIFVILMLINSTRCDHSKVIKKLSSLEGLKHIEEI